MSFLLNELTHTGGRLRHAFIGIGFRERSEAYDFQAALHDHMKYFPIFIHSICLPYYLKLVTLNYVYCIGT